MQAKKKFTCYLNSHIFSIDKLKSYECQDLVILLLKCNERIVWYISGFIRKICGGNPLSGFDSCEEVILGWMFIPFWFYIWGELEIRWWCYCPGVPLVLQLWVAILKQVLSSNKFHIVNTNLKLVKPQSLTHWAQPPQPCHGIANFPTTCANLLTTPPPPPWL